ncbi:helix-turn-helix domain-containing protein [Streptomyces sp. NPDC018031]|uniref:helix-turn-helix domain-containing protein n=1 Tax=Streptomyces sp. NPDC018031 TaxID=3365033 RepID=UPI00378F39B5
MRAAKGLSLRHVAERSGIDPGHLSKVERGEKHLSVESLHRLAVVLELRELATLLAPYVVKPRKPNNDDGARDAAQAPSVEHINESTAQQTGSAQK